eukprot:TRINITY_DN6380_c0_g1_i1.p1 TRINITY_DN6380_c0_g1~~TRINITY_DN6380_c0_g1_i1.p1  ORF type:complete len:842 (-),score=166.79 TRINITY_DN6380_c0_g1_i1:259-2784(-)
MGCVCSKGPPEESPNKNPRTHHRRSSSGTQQDAPKHQLNGPTVKPNQNGHSQDQLTVVTPHTRTGTADLVPARQLPKSLEATSLAAGWPQWLAGVAGEAIKGWIPRRADSFEKLDKIGQGTYSNVYKARDLEDGSIVALKKVRFDNLEPESVRFMAREIEVLRRLDHPNVVKLRGLVTSRMSCSLYLVFEYMEHDLAGLAACPGVMFTEAQVKCYMLQLLRGLEHCHARGVLHRDIKGSNLLLDNRGYLKIADFGLATFYNPNQNVPLTSRVVTLWYRPPELLLGATNYGVAVDLWSTGCILAELLAGKPIMPGRTEVEQLHKIFKLCGSPSEEYWRKSKLPHATIFKPQQPYKRNLLETFKDFPASSLALLDTLLAIEPADRGTAAAALKSDFFTTKPLPCDPSSLPEYPPSKEYDAKLRDEEARRARANGTRGSRPSENGRRSSQGARPERTSRAVPNAGANAELETSIAHQKAKQLRPLHVSGPLPGPAGKNKSEMFAPVIEHSMGFQGLGPNSGHLPGETRDSPGITAPQQRINPHISSKSGPQPMLKPGAPGTTLWAIPKPDDDSRIPPPAPGRMMTKPTKSITVPDFALQGGYGPPPGMVLADTASSALASGLRADLSGYRLSSGNSGELSTFRGQSLREQREAQAQAQLNAQSQVSKSHGSALHPERVEPFRRESQQDSYRMQMQQRAPALQVAQQQRPILQSQSLPPAGHMREDRERDSAEQPSNQPNNTLPPPPWMARESAAQNFRKTSGTFADKRLFEHKGWMVVTSTTQGQNGISEPLQGEDGSGNIAAGKVDSKRKWMPRFSDGFAADRTALSASAHPQLNGTKNQGGT